MKNKKVLLILFVVLMLFGFRVNAKSKYYELIWQNEESTEDQSVVNDVIKLDDGYMAVGYEDGGRPFVRVFNQDGTLRRTVSLNSRIQSRLKRVFEVEDGYLVIGVGGGRLQALMINNRFSLSDVIEYDVPSWGFDQNETYLVKVNDELYIFNGENYETYLVKYDLKENYFEDVEKEEVSEDVINALGGYVQIKEYDSCYSVFGDSSSGGNVKGVVKADEGDVLPATMPEEPEYCSVFIEEYNGGYVYGLYSNFGDSKVIYYNDGEKWVKDYEHEFVKDGVQFSDNFILTSYIHNEDDTTVATLKMVDKDGKELEMVDIKDYNENEDIVDYQPEHLIKVNNGFALTGLSLVCDLGDVNGAGDDANVMVQSNAVLGAYDSGNCISQSVMYFETIYKVKTKTIGKGNINVNKVSSGAGELIEFTVEPQKGYVLGSVKVTDNKGNTIVFTDNKFTMPTDDVTIEVEFVLEVVQGISDKVEEIKEVIVENPVTASGVGIGVIVLLILSGHYFFKNKRVLKD